MSLGFRARRRGVALGIALGFVLAACGTPQASYDVIAPNVYVGAERSCRDLELSDVRCTAIILRAVRELDEARPGHAAVKSRSLHADGYPVAVVNPYRSRKFADALGQLAKTDKIDARVLALLGESLNPDARPPTPKQVAELQEIVLARQATLAEAVALENSLKATESRFLVRERSRWLKSLRERIKRLERAISQRIQADPEMARRFEVLTSIPGIGPVVAATLIACLAEIGGANSKEVAALAGLAPFNRDSGDMRGQRHIKGGRAHVRTPLYFAAIAAVRTDPGFMRFAQRLRAAGKPAKVILTAVMRKLVVLANTLVSQNRTWQPEPPKHA